MPDYRSIDSASEKLFDAVLQRISDKLEIRPRDSEVGVKLLSHFDSLNTYQSLYVHKVTELKGRDGSFLLMLLEKHLNIVVSKKAGRIEKPIEEVEPVVVISISQDMGRIFIRPETLADKLTDLVTRIDIDFADYPEFSKNYYVAAEKPELVRKHLPRKLMEALGKVDGLTIEINGHWGLIRTETNLSEELLMLLLSIGYKMTK